MELDNMNIRWYR